MVDKRCGPPSLQFAIVSTDSQSLDDRQGIIDAAYGCLYEPHSGPIPVAAILGRAGLSTRAFYRHFSSKDELFLAMLRQEGEALAGRLDRIVDEVSGGPVEQLTAWIETMYVLARDPDLRMHLTVIDSDEVRAATGLSRGARAPARRPRAVAGARSAERARRWFVSAGAAAARRRLHQRDRVKGTDDLGARQRRRSAARQGSRARLRAAGLGCGRSLDEFRRAAESVMSSPA